jgi:hypothetical protein
MRQPCFIVVTVGLGIGYWGIGLTGSNLLSEGKIDYLLTQVNAIGLHSTYCLWHRKINPFAFCTEQYSY